MLESGLVKDDPIRHNPEARDEVIEVGLLLSPRQLCALEAQALKQGLTTGGIMRQILRDYLHQSAGSRAEEA